MREREVAVSVIIALLHKPGGVYPLITKTISSVYVLFRVVEVATDWEHMSWF